MSTLDEAMDRWRAMGRQLGGVVTVTTSDEGVPVIEIAGETLFGACNPDPRLPGYQVIARAGDGFVAIGYPAGQTDGHVLGADRDGTTCDLGTLGEFLDLAASFADDVLPDGIDDAREMSYDIDGVFQEDDYAEFVPEIAYSRVAEEVYTHVELITGYREPPEPPEPIEVGHWFQPKTS